MGQGGCTHEVNNMAKQDLHNNNIGMPVWKWNYHKVPPLNSNQYLLRERLTDVQGQDP